MCLLVVLHRTHPEAPLIVAANRDELLAREATAMTVLAEGPPRVLGGRDHAAGGTWLAVNERSVFGALTNRPAGRRNPEMRSRGEWPLFLAGFGSAAAAAAAFVAKFPPAEFNPGWVLVGDGRDLFYIDMTRATARPLELEPGVHILENRPLDARSSKVEHVRRQLEGLESVRGDRLVERLRSVLASHAIPAGAGEELAFEGAPTRPPAAGAACVHLGAYGTRSSSIIRATQGGTPRVWSSEGPPCTTPLVEVTDLWDGADIVGEAVAGG